ncbi:hypothetical protein [Erythrobacter sp.]|jgi:hypothetical protein|uniref:hypothetical protein n=1 Tax=Erythrobacter sp. TaxID=1042 RepID=UPI002E9DA416|nr:hypothetical protein [Erythrobacter sp.]
MSGERFDFDPALKKALGENTVPDLPEGFADRVVAATEGRAPPLPQQRTASSRWRTSRRLAIGLVSAGALASAAAATGVLEELGVDLPSPQEVWSSITGAQPAPAPSPSPPASTAPEPVPDARAPVVIEGPIDTPEELEEAFRRVDQRREERVDTRRSRVDQRIGERIDARRAQGLPAPTQEQEERLSDRLDTVRENADARRAARIEERREALREDVEAGGEITRENFIEADRTRLRNLSPEQRRDRLRQWRERRQERLRRLESEGANASGSDPLRKEDDANPPSNDPNGSSQDPQ